MFVPSFIRIERGLEWAYDLILNNVSLFARNSVNTNASLSAAPNLALVPSCRYYYYVN